MITDTARQGAGFTRGGPGAHHDKVDDIEEIGTYIDETRDHDIRDCDDGLSLKLTGATIRRHARPIHCNVWVRSARSRSRLRTLSRFLTLSDGQCTTHAKIGPQTVEMGEQPSNGPELAITGHHIKIKNDRANGTIR